MKKYLASLAVLSLLTLGLAPANTQGQAPPPPPVPAEAVRAPQDGASTQPGLSSVPVADRPATAKPAASPSTIRREEPRRQPTTNVTPVPCVPPDDVLAMVARMTRGLAEGLKAEDLGRRRVGPAKLARQLAELRRRHGRRKAEMKPPGEG